MKAESARAATIDEYIGEFPAEVQRILSELRATIRKAAPQATEKISYRMPTFDYNGNLVHFAAYKQHVGFYPTLGGITAFRKELAAYKSSKGAVQFPLDEALPTKLITRIVKFRVGENAGEKHAAKRRSR
jgi:uncharacterized protein YdhG (YjbR/CyaY superfamily)